MSVKQHLLVALAGQPNCGKSTVFNMLTGARQHVANYPGVTVEKKTGYFTQGADRVELVDLPGTYSLTSYSLEERVARDFLLNNRPDLVIDVVDASNLRHHLYLTLQLLEMNVPVVVCLNMMDVAKRRDLRIDASKLETLLGVPVMPTTARNSQGRDALRESVNEHHLICDVFQIDYGALEQHISTLSDKLAQESKLTNRYPLRWISIKLLENDDEAISLIQSKLGAQADHVLDLVALCREEFNEASNNPVERHIAFTRHRECSRIASETVEFPEVRRRNMSDQLDKFVCNRFFGPLILVAILYVLYQVSIVFGGWLAVKVWPVWGGLETLAGDIFPNAGFLEDPLLRGLGVWIVKSTTAILNYLPIFFLLFALIAIMEDSGYMPRMAFILDRLFRRFGLHGQSTLPLILGGVYVGGCAIPGVMATKAIPDERARLTTIMIVPMMNCLAKVPLYLILIDAYFSDVSGLAMFFIATVTLFMALPVAKLLSMTVLSKFESAPFIMEMPPYHMPAILGVLRRAFERIWLFLKKIVTFVAAIAVVVFVLINYPGLSTSRMAHYENLRDMSVSSFINQVEQTQFKGKIASEDVINIILFDEYLKQAKSGVTESSHAEEINVAFKAMNPTYYAIIKRVGSDGRKLNKELRKVIKVRKRLRREMRTERFENSALGHLGRWLEPVTQFAGFNWRINVALLSAFAAKENSAATLGAIYGIDGSSQSVQDNMKASEGGFTALHALALMLFMALYPPCVPASMMVRHQAGTTRWMLFSIGYQMLLGFFIATLVFTGGSLLDLSGFQAMWAFYGLCVLATVAMALIPTREEIGALEPVEMNTNKEINLKGG